MNVPADDQLRLLCQHRIANRGATEMPPARINVEYAKGWCMYDPNRPARRIAEVHRGLLFGQVIAITGKRRHRNRPSETEKRLAAHLDTLAM